MSAVVRWYLWPKTFWIVSKLTFFDFQDRAALCRNKCGDTPAAPGTGDLIPALAAVAAIMRCICSHDSDPPVIRFDAKIKPLRRPTK